MRRLLAGVLGLGFVMLASQSTVQAGLIGYWNLNNQAYDHAGSNDLKRAGDVTFAPSVAPGLGLAGSFDGDGDGFISGTYAPISGNDATVMAWVYANTLNDWATIAKNWGHATAGQFHYGAGQGAADSMDNFVINSVGGFENANSAATLIPTGEWAHVAFVLDSTAGTHTLYINGNSVGSSAYLNGLVQVPGVSAFGIGVKPNDSGTDVDTANGGAAQGAWDGYIDEVGIYDEALTAIDLAQIISNAQQGIQLDGTSVPEPSTVVVLTAACAGLIALRKRIGS